MKEVKFLSKNHNDSDCQCECIEELAKQLKSRIGDRILVNERNGDWAVGRIKDVKNGSVLILDDVPNKTWCSCGTTLSIQSIELIISICEITEFSVTNEAQEAQLLNSLNQHT
jgi:hypothetical protein